MSTADRSRLKLVAVATRAKARWLEAASSVEPLVRDDVEATLAAAYERTQDDARSHGFDTDYRLERVAWFASPLAALRALGSDHQSDVIAPWFRCPFPYRHGVPHEVRDTALEVVAFPLFDAFADVATAVHQALGLPEVSWRIPFCATVDSWMLAGDDFRQQAMLHTEAAEDPRVTAVKTIPWFIPCRHQALVVERPIAVRLGDAGYVVFADGWRVDASPTEAASSPDEPGEAQGGGCLASSD